MKKVILLSLIAFVSFGLSGCNYNSLTAQQQNVKGKFANIETLLQSRNDLIPNLVEAAKLAGIQEQEVFGQIADARARLAGAQSAAPSEAKTPEQREAVIQANNQLGGALSRLLVLQESYPQLRSNESFLKLQDSIEGTERRIAVARQDYNTAVQTYNTERAQFPGVLTASIFGFQPEPFFQAEEGARQAPRINSNDLRRNNAPAQTAPQTR